MLTMDENQRVVETTLDRIVFFFRKHLYNVLLFVISVAFLFKDIIKIEESGKTLPEIIASSFMAFTVGTMLNVIMGKKGILAGKSTPHYIETMARYSQEINKTDEYIEKLDYFCDDKNNKRIKAAQIRVLRTERIKYDDFINKTMEEVCKTKKQIKCWKKAQNVKVQHLTADNLLSETDDRYEKGRKELTLAEYERSENRSDFIAKLGFAIIFGYFGVSIEWNYENMIWGAIQIGSWLLLGIGRYIQNYSYVTEVYKSKIHRKINFLVEFNTIMRKGGNNNEF
jgi:hypothetical protein